jgi:nicotinate-nucleotide adenylyltransferase
MAHLGVFGGSFNPVHWGHLHIALLAREAAGLDEVVYVPAASPPHKPGWELAPPQDRWEMLTRALRSESGSTLSDVELLPGGPRYTVDTMDLLQERHSGWKLSFLLGMDSLAEFDSWREPDRLVKKYGLIAVNRPGLVRAAVDRRWQGRVTLVDGNPFAISSSAIRDRVTKGLTIRHLVPAPVEAVIAERGLYRPEKA